MKNQVIIEALRRGLPPERGVGLYSVGHEKLINGIKRFHLSQIPEVGKIRFVSGSWGSGKTHFFRLLREVAFSENCLVSNVELNVNEAPLNKFERVFYSIVRNITTPSSYEIGIVEASPFSNVVFEALSKFGDRGENDEEISYETYAKACEILMANKGIDIDFKKIIQEYWKTYLLEGAEKSIVDQKREEILQWFAGEGTKGVYRKNFGVNKMVSRDNAKIMLQSLSEFVKLAGYRGLVILFDEAEQSYSTMRKSALRDAHNNLLSLINGIEALSGIFLVYATTPDFYIDSKHGIVVYGALSGRIGKPEDHPPKALDTVWNLDAVVPTLDNYHEVAKKIRSLYLETDPQTEELVMNEGELVSFVDDLYDLHPSLSSVRFWRVLVAGLIKKFDEQMEEEEVQTEQIYDDIMDLLREE
ncbi:BREX system ATP-binding domain-containing protein [Methanosarcina sp. 2.H.A.1B.4]|uniref:BREX system ATP-binding domain-containing protein n=1 Tax=Methanosarcina sp. 2.H.A.1B.4 TaxID=1483600 RepID=UPI00062227CA|nr:BREX system ATP-binding domain-containing protein [Methanosarcina sp. 2.H.A.1B.4]KKG12533.1 hypothetical protein EO92_01580 [Methanosarcina sp. 2.H.A.1B.4]